MSFKLDFNHDDLPLPADAIDGDLPADFEALGEQLQADAARLSSVYPACRPPLELIDALGAVPSRRWLSRTVVARLSTAAALVLVAGLIGFAVSPVWLPSGVTERAVPPKLSTPIAAIPAAAESVEMTFPSSPLSFGNPDLLPISYRPAVLEFNGPELEGLLDLWNEQPRAAATISF